MGGWRRQWAESESQLGAVPCRVVCVVGLSSV